jgi:predicted phosphoribosyltransferase
MFADRRQAGRELAALLSRFRGREDAVVLAIPRGGVALGAVLAAELGLPLDVILAKKIGHPDNPEYAIGAVGLEGEEIDEDVVERDGIPRAYLDAQIARLRALLRKRQALYHRGRAELSLAGKTAVVCDDGIATGDTMFAAIRAARRAGAARVVAAVPVAPPAAAAQLERLADETVCPLRPDEFYAIGQFYRDFTQVEDEEAIRLLDEAAARRKAPR